ncbi:hypothetical protein V8C86DRAFT_69366 [Haematococcus lacustris]
MLQGQNNNLANQQQCPAQQVLPSRDAEDGNTQDQIHHWVGHMPGREKTTLWEKIAMVLAVIKMALACWGLTYSWMVLDALSTGKVYGVQLDALVAKQASDCDGGISSEVQGLRICFILAASLLAFEFLGWVVTVETWLSTRNSPEWNGNGSIGQCMWICFHRWLKSYYHVLLHCTTKRKARAYIRDLHDLFRDMLCLRARCTGPNLTPLLPSRHHIAMVASAVRCMGCASASSWRCHCLSLSSWAGWSLWRPG